MAQLVAEADGRRLRREQNRDAVIDALLALFADGIYRPTSMEIAARAQLSARSLFRYFDDIDELHRVAAARQFALVFPLLAIRATPQDPTAVKVEQVIHARASVFEDIAPAARALRACAHRDQMLARELDRRRAIYRRQVSEVFAPELARASGGTLPAVDVLCSFECYDLFRHHHGLSQADTTAALAAALRALLLGEPDG
jgi:AcrR family transcriptional regulator